MSRSERLLDLLRVLRRYRRPVTGTVLADQIGVSQRTLYRDIASLRSQGAVIDGEPGVGYVLRPGFLLPPLMFSEEEIEALVLGSRWVARSTDQRLAAAAETALDRITAVLPEELREYADSSTLIVGPRPDSQDERNIGTIRAAIRSERKLAMTYRDASGGVTERIVWPFALGFFENARMMAAWCELRLDFRHFRADRITDATLRAERYPRRRLVLMREWKRLRGSPKD